MTESVAAQELHDLAFEALPLERRGRRGPQFDRHAGAARRSGLDLDAQHDLRQAPDAGRELDRRAYLMELSLIHI